MGLALIITNGIVFVLNIGPVYCQFAQGNANSSVICMSLWVMVAAFDNFVNNVAWYSDSASRLPGWCDISIKLQIGGQLGRPAASMCIARFLASVVSPRATAITRQDRRNRAIYDCVMCFGVPAIAMACHILYQPTRYAITRGTGCSPTAFLTWPTLLLWLIWPSVFIVCGAIYAIYVVYRVVKHRRDFGRIVSGAHSALTTSRFARLMIFSIFYVVLGLPLAAMVPMGMIRAAGYYWDYSYSYLKLDWHIGVTHLNAPADPSSASLNFWSDVVVAAVYFLCFGLGAESLALYGTLLKKVGLRVSGDRSWVSAEQDMSLKGKRWGSSAVGCNRVPIPVQPEAAAYGGAFHVKYGDSYETGVSRGVKVVVEREEDIV